MLHKVNDYVKGKICFMKLFEKSALKSRVTLFSIGIVVLSLYSCRKYEEGSNFSILSKKFRITGDWMLYEIRDAYGNDVDITNYSENLFLNYDGSFSKTEITYSDNTVLETTRSGGSWRFVDDTKSLALINNRENIDLKYTIVRLTNSELKIRNEETKELYYFVPL